MLVVVYKRVLGHLSLCDRCSVFMPVSYGAFCGSVRGEFLGGGGVAEWGLRGLWACCGACGGFCGGLLWVGLWLIGCL